MSFTNKCSTIIRRSNMDMFYIYHDNEVIFNYFDNNNTLISSSKLTNNSLDFSDFYFDLDKFDNVYGIYNDEISLKMIEIPKGSNTITHKEILTYDSNKFNLTFPHIKIINDELHIFYYVYNASSYNTCALFHHYKSNGIWTENKIDFVNHIVLDDFTVIWNQNSPIVFYFNLVNGYEEIFLSRFNCSTLTWSTPIQVTNSNKNKIYLSVIKDNMNFYHISFCENVGNGYAIKYLNGYLNEDKLEIEVSIFVTGPSACMYPSLIKNKSSLYLLWVNHGKLNTSVSNNLGKSWSEHIVDDFSIEEDFTRANFFSNYELDSFYNVSSVFTTCNDIGLLGF